MIPKIIHYCWFGENELPDLAKKCIESWKRYCPEYEIIEWNESNFNLECCDFVKEAYQAKKWAFVSDYARLKIIYDNGGIYLDTDVELVKTLDSLLEEKCYFAEETTGYATTGLGFGAEKNNSTIKMLMNEYIGKHFILEDGIYDIEPCPIKNTRALTKFGYKFDGKNIWRCEEFTIYPPEFFCPLDYHTKIMNMTDNTISVHLYNSSWLDKRMQARRENVEKIRKCIKGKKGIFLSNAYMKCSYYWEWISTGNYKMIKQKIVNKIKKKKIN